MKKVSLFLVFMLVMGVVFSAAQIVPGKKYEAGASIDYYSLGQGGSTYANYLFVPLHFGWYVWKGLEIEPEFAVNIPLKYVASLDVTCLGTLNVFYNYRIGKKFVPFIGGGFSMGNGIPYAEAEPYGMLYGDANYNSTALNLGGGLKYLLADNVAIRAEYRYSNFRCTVDGQPDHVNYKINRAFIGLCFMF